MFSGYRQWIFYFFFSVESLLMFFELTHYDQRFYLERSLLPQIESTDYHRVRGITEHNRAALLSCLTLLFHI